MPVFHIDSSRTTARFAVRHLGISTVHGTMTGVDGTLHYDPHNPEGSFVEASIDVRTVSTGMPERDDILRDRFFDAARCPFITFASDRVEVIKPKRAAVYGHLTICGITRPVALDVGHTFADENGRSVFTVHTRLNRLDFGLSWSPFVEQAGLVGHDVDLLLVAQVLPVALKAAV